jgi:hypothetical protein
MKIYMAAYFLYNVNYPTCIGGYNNAVIGMGFSLIQNIRIEIGHRPIFDGIGYRKTSAVSCSHDTYHSYPHTMSQTAPAYLRKFSSYH